MAALSARELPSAGLWRPAGARAAFHGDELPPMLSRVREPLHVVRDGSGRIGVALGGEVAPPGPRRESDHPLLATLPPLYPEWLGDRSFGEIHRVRFPYVAGEMANGIATTRLVIAMGQAEMLGFFGAAGLYAECRGG